MNKRILIYTKHNTTKAWKYLASGLEGVSSCIIVSEFRNDGDVWIMPEFYKRFKDAQTVKVVSQYISDADYEDIIRRCRLLRNLKYELAIKMISAMWLAINDLIDKERPDMILSFTIDYYALDLLERISSRRGIPFYGLMSSILKDKFMISARGEYNHLHDSSDEQVSQALAEMKDDKFAPFLSNNPKYSRNKFWAINLRYIFRSYVFWVLRYLTNNPLNSHLLMTRIHVDDYRTGLKDRKVVDYLDHSWEEKIREIPVNRRFFIGLQQNPEASIDYWVDNLDLINYENVLYRLIKALSAEGFAILIKDHPNMYALRKLDFIKELYSLSNTIMIPYEVRSQDLIRECGYTFTWTGTIGLQARLAGKYSIVANPYYAMEDEFFQIRTLEDIDLIPTKLISSMQQDIKEPARERLAKRVSDGSLPGSLMPEYWLRFSVSEAAKVSQLRLVTDSLCKYLRTR